MAADVEICSIGAWAARLLRQHTDWLIAATFERSFYLRSGDNFVCIGDASIGDGPLNVLTPTDVIPPFVAGTHGAANSSVEVAARWVPGTSPGMTAGTGFALTVGFTNGAVLAANDARIWQPPPWPIPALDALASDRLQDLMAAAISTAPLESFIHALVVDVPVDALRRRAHAGTANLRAALADATSAKSNLAVTSLAGLGHGLTPSGDDVLAGASIMLHALGKAVSAAALGQAVRGQMRNLTSPLSAAFLDVACDGEPNAAVHRAITALFDNGPPDAVIAPLSLIGATSGFDMLAGMLIAAGCEGVTPSPPARW